MTRRDWLWVGLKLFGLYLLLEAVLAVPDVLQGGAMWYGGLSAGTGGISSGSTSSIDTAAIMIAHSMVGGGRAMLVGASARLVLFGGLGLYFVRGGEGLLKMMCREQESS